MNNKDWFENLVEENKQRILENKQRINLNGLSEEFRELIYYDLVDVFSEFVGEKVDTIEKLLSYDMDVYVDFFEENPRFKTFDGFKEFIYGYGFVFEKEFEGTDISEEIATIRIKDLEDLSIFIEKKLYDIDIYYLGELLKCDFTDKYIINMLGDFRIGEIKYYLNEIGLDIEDQMDFINRKIDEYRTQGITLLEDIIKDEKFCLNLYKNGIFTVSDLENRKNEIINLNIDNFGAKSLVKLMGYSEELGIDFTKENISLDTEICNIKSLSFIKRKLNRLGIFTFGDLLNFEFKDFFGHAYLYLGDNCLWQLKNIVHNMGYELKNEFELPIEIKNRLKKENKKLIDEIISSPSLCEKLNESNIYTVEDFVNLGNKVFDIYNLTEKNKKDLRNAIASLGVVNNVVNNSNANNITMDTYLDDINGFPENCTKKLYRRGIFSLRDLLERDFDDICKTRGLGETALIELKNCLHSLGYSIEGEYDFVCEKVDKLRESGVELLSDLFNETTVCSFLYRNNIFTADDLIHGYEIVLNMSNFGDKRKERLYELMNEHNLKFVNADKILMLGEVVKAPTNDNDIVNLNENLIEKKTKTEKLYDEIIELLDEKNKLLEREKEIDLLISQKIKEISVDVSYTKKMI